VCQIVLKYFVIYDVLVIEFAVERFSLGVRNPTAFLAGALVSD